MSIGKEKYNIICLSNQLWDFPLWTNKKHVMLRLAKEQHSVIFVDPPINTGFVFLKHLKAKNWSFKRFLTQIKKEYGLTVFSPLNPLPFYKILAQYHIKKINILSRKIFKNEQKTILWIYHVEIDNLENYINGIKHDLLVYDCVDNYEGFPKYNDKAKKEDLISKEAYLAKKADIIFATAPGLVEKLRKYNSKVYFTPNVGDYEKFVNVKTKKTKLPDDLKGIKRPVIGYTGAVDEYKFDRELMKKIAQDYPNYSFVIIGPLALKDREATLDKLGILNLPNIHYLGTKHYQLIHEYFAGFDAFIIPYQLNDYTVGGCFPVKFHDALAVGIPVIVTNMPAYYPFFDVCYISNSYNEFSQNIRRALEEDTDSRKKSRQLVAKENNWEGKVQKMLEIINNHLNAKTVEQTNI